MKELYLPNASSWAEKNKKGVSMTIFAKDKGTQENPDRNPSRATVISEQNGNLISAKEQRSHRAKLCQRVVSVTAILLCFAFAVWGGVSLFAGADNACAVVVDGKSVAVLTSEEDAQAAIDLYVATHSEKLGAEVTYGESVTLEPVSVGAMNCLSPEETLAVLDDVLTEVVAASIIYVNDTEVAILPTEEDAQAAVEAAKKYYAREDYDILDIEVAEEIHIIKGWRTPDCLVTTTDATNLLLFGTVDPVIHVVESADETLWSIVKQYDIEIGQVQNLNPGLTSDDLEVGMEVKIAAANPLLHITVTRNIVAEQELPYAVIYENNAEKLRGQEEILVPGEAGVAQVTTKVVELNGQELSRESVDSVIVREPVTQVVERGTKLVVASRGDGYAAGQLGWPLLGLITSRFGGRAIGYHTGLDIDGETGDPVVAADSGTVLFADNSAGYGLIVKLDHGDGLQTWYAHLDKIHVSVGQTVERGELIGDVGSTGRSSGSHLHFEVIIDDVQYDPLDFLP